MKKFIITFIVLPVILFVQGQPGPATNGVYCPNTTTTFHYTMSGSISDYSGAQATGTAMTGISGSQAVQNISAVSLSSGGTSVVWTFTGNFVDWAAPQGIMLSWTDISGNSQSITYHYDQIASYHTTGSPGALPQPAPSTILPSMAQIQSFNITVPSLQYVDYYTSPVLKYGSVTSFQYLLPAGWSLGTTLSDGLTWLNGTGNVTVTSDACTAGNILVRGTTCGSNLTVGPPATISVSRPAPTFTIGSTGSGAFCSGDTRSFSVNNLPSGATVSWTASPSGVVTINSPNSTTTGLTRTGDGVVILTSTITFCGNTYTATSSGITVGSPAPTSIAKGPGTNSDVEVTCTAVPGATSYNWLMNGTAMANQHSTGCDMFPVTCNQTILACVSAVNACGTSAYHCASIKNTPCIGGFGTFVVSPNPASGTINVTSVPEVSSGTKTNDKVSKSFNEIRVYDQQGTLKKRLVYHNVSQASIDVSALSVGTYFIEIVSGADVDRQALIIRK